VSSKSIVVGISGASGSIIGIRLLEELKKQNIETHLVITDDAKPILEHETNYKVADVEKLANHTYSNKDFFAPIASGSFRTDAMVIVPCSMKTLAGIANGFSENLLLRAADVFLKERKRIIIVPRETPLSHIHVENMYKVSTAGAVILPAMVSLYSKPENIDELINHLVGKILDMLGIDNDVYKRWKQ
jgi:flavin prenyltransferase